MSSNLELLLPEPPPDVPNFIWATLMLKSPARVRIDGETAVIPVERDALIDFTDVAIGERILLVRQRTRLIAVGVGGGIPLPDPPTIPTAATLATVDAKTNTTEFVTPSTLANRNYAPYSEAAGRSTTVAGGTITVTFPSGRFSVPPIVLTGSVIHPNVSVTYIDTVTTTGFNLRAFTIGGGQIAATVDWHAVQMTSSAAPG